MYKDRKKLAEALAESIEAVLEHCFPVASDSEYPIRPRELPEDQPHRFCGWVREDPETGKLMWCALYEPADGGGGEAGLPAEPARWADYAVMRIERAKRCSG